MVPIGDQPDDGFTGPGRAWKWLSDRGETARFGVDLFVVSDTGLRPAAGTNKKERILVGQYTRVSYRRLSEAR